MQQYNNKLREIETRGIKMKRKPMFDQTNTTLLNGIKISFQKGFGFSQDPEVKSNAYCIDDNRIIYILASQIVVYDLLSESQKIIDNFDCEEQIGAMIYFKNIMLEDNIIYGVHNANKSFPSLMMHNFSKNFNQKIMLANLEKEQRITEIVLFNEYRNIALISTFDKIIRLTIVQTSTKQIKLSEFLSFHPKNMLQTSQFSTKLILQGQQEIYVTDMDSDLKLTSLMAKNWLEVENQKIVQITTSLNLQLSLYAITDKGNLYFFSLDLKENKITKSYKQFLGTFKTVDEETGKQIQMHKKPSSITANQYNILIGYQLLQQFTLVKIYTVSTQNPTFETIKFSCPYLHKIVRMNFAAETMAVCVIVQVKQNDKYDFCIPIDSNFFKERNEDKIVRQNVQNHKLKQGKIFPIIFNLLLYDTLVETLRSPVQTVLNSMLMTKKILDVCVLPTKRLILILSGDKRIKAVKYQNVASISFQKMLAWQMIFNQSDQITSLDVHPMIFTVAVGFKQGIKLFTMFSDGMKPTNIQFPLKNCQCVKYSRFGHLLIAGSSNQIVLINPYQNKIINTIQLNYGFNTRQLHFIDRDMYLFAAYNNGSTQVLNLQGNKIFEVWNKSSKCVASFYDPIFDVMIMSYEDNQVKFYREKGQMQFAIMWTFPFVITKILVANQLGTAFMGTSTGKIRAYQWPFTDMIKFNKSFTQIQLHRSAITQIKIAHDYTHLITGSQDGSIFISKLTAYSDGMIVSDSSILHTFKVNKKNYTSLYYLQNLICTNNSRQSQKQQQILQYQLDKVDFQTDENFILQSLKQQIQQKLKEQQTQHQKSFKNQLQPYQQTIQQLNQKKQQVNQQYHKLMKDQEKERFDLEQQKLNKMRKLYKEADHLKIKLDFYQKIYKEEVQKNTSNYDKQFQSFEDEMKSGEQNLLKDCKEIQRDLGQSQINYHQLLKQEEEEGQIYKKKMMEKLEEQLSESKHKGEQLRKVMNKNNHEILTIQDKYKFFLHLTSELGLDIENNTTKSVSLTKNVKSLTSILKQKDQQIFDQQKAVKQLLKKNINNYSHEQYLKHKQEQLINKAKYLQKQIQNLDQKYKVFQDNFVDASKQNNQNMNKIQQAYKLILQLKANYEATKNKKYMSGYWYKNVYDRIIQTFHQCHSKKVFNDKIVEILNEASSQENNINFSPNNTLPIQQSAQKSLQSPQLSRSLSDNNKSIQQQNYPQAKPAIQKRDHLIDQVINSNKLRKIDDTIRRTIMIKLNRQTVNLTSQVNQLRKQKKKLSIKTRDLTKYIKQMQKQLNYYENKQNSMLQPSLTDIVPAYADISVIKSQNSKYSPINYAHQTNTHNNNTTNNTSKPLPFQIYHTNKQSSLHSNTTNNINKLNAKSISDENSTQLPSIIKSQNSGYHNINISSYHNNNMQSNNQSYSGSILQQTNLSGVQEIDDDIIMNQ